MNPIKILIVLVVVYVGIVATFESLLGYFQPEGDSTLVITTTEDGKPHSRVVARLESGGVLYVAANHWPRAWYHQALDNPEVQATLSDNTADYIAVPVDDTEHERVNSEHPLGLVFRILTGFPPRYFLRLDPVIVAPELIDRQVLFQNPDRFQGRLSPDGQQMSFLAPVDGVMNVWVAPAGKISEARAITADTGRGIHLHSWALDSQHVIYQQDKDGDENWHLYSIDLATTAIVDLSPYPGVQARLVEQSPDKPGIAIIAMNDRDARWHDLYTVELNKGTRKLLLKNDGYGEILVDNSLTVRLAVKQTPAGGQEVFERKNNAWKLKFNIPPEDALTTGFVGFNGDNTGVYMVDSRGRDTSALMLLNLASGETTPIAALSDADIADAIIDPRTHTPVAYATNIHSRHWVSLGSEYDDDVAALNDIEGDARVLYVTLDGMRWIVFADTGNASPRYVVYDRAEKQLRTLFVTEPALDDLPLAAMHGVTIKSRDGMDLVSYLTLPTESDPDGDGAPNAALPMVLLVHGGPWGRDEFGYSGMIQWLANRGYAVLQVNFRASTGFGKAFVNAGNREWAGAMHNDLLDAVDWAVTQNVALPDKIAIMGGSYGGYATLVGLTFTPDVFQCGVDIVGPSNLNTLLNSIPPYWEGFKRTFVVAIGDPETEEGQTLLASRSPINFTDRITRPLLIGQGANDPRVNQSESDQIVAAMSGRDIPVTYILYPDEGHGFARPENNLSFNAVTEAFLAGCIGGRYQPIGDDFAGSSIKVMHGAEHVPGLAEAVQ